MSLAIGLAVVSCDKKDGEGDDGSLPGNVANFSQGAKSKMSALGKCVEGSKIVCYMDAGQGTGFAGNNIHYIVATFTNNVCTGITRYDFYANNQLYSAAVQAMQGAGYTISEKDDNNYWLRYDADSDEIGDAGSYQQYYNALKNTPYITVVE